MDTWFKRFIWWNIFKYNYSRKHTNNSRTCFRIKTNASGVISLIDYETGDEALLQNFSSNLYIDMKIASKSINIGTISANTNVNIGSATSSNIIAGATITSRFLTANAGIISTTLKANTGIASTTNLPLGSGPIVYYLRHNQ